MEANLVKCVFSAFIQRSWQTQNFTFLLPFLAHRFGFLKLHPLASSVEMKKSKLKIWNLLFIFLSSRRVSSFLAWGHFHACSRFARSTISEEKLGTTRSLASLRSVPNLETKQCLVYKLVDLRKRQGHVISPNPWEHVAYYFKTSFQFIHDYSGYLR